MGRFTDFLTGKSGQREAQPAPIQLVGFPLSGGVFSGYVSATTALGLSAVWRSIDILSNGVALCDWSERRGNLEIPASRLVQRPQAERTRREWVSLVVSTLALHDVAYLLKAGGTDATGEPMALWPLDPSLVQPIQTDAWSPLPPTEYMVMGNRIPATDLVILHRSPQPGINETTASVLNIARVTFAAAMAAEGYASRYWQSGGSPNVVLESDANIPDPVATQLGDRWRERRSKGPDYAPVLTNGLKAKSFGADPTTESAVEARKELVADIGRYFGVPPRLLNSVASDSETYASAESANQDLARFTLSNYVKAIEDAVSDQLSGGRRLVIDMSPLTRGTQLAQAQALQLATGGKPWMTQDEARDVWGLPPVENSADLTPVAHTPSTSGATNG